MAQYFHRVGLWLACATIAALAFISTVGFSQEAPLREQNQKPLTGDTSSIYTFTAVQYPGASVTDPAGVNSQGDLAGNFAFPGEYEQAFLDLGGSYSDLTCPGEFAAGLVGINDSDQAVGSCETSVGAGYSFLYSSGTFTTISFPGSVGTGVSGINNAGEVVGAYTLNNNTSYGFLYSGGAYTTIAYPGSILSGANGINNLGQVVGVTDARRGYLYSNGVFSTIEFPGAQTTFPYSINDYGEIVGTYTDSENKYHGFLYFAGVYTSIEVPGATINDFFGLNNSGEITAWVGANGMTGTLAPNPTASLSQTTLNFGDEALGIISPVQRVLLTSAGAQALQISSVSVSGEFLLSNGCPSSLPPGASCNLSVTFRPTTRGAQAGTVTIQDNAVNSPQTISLAGTGVFFEISPGSLNFGSVPVGQSGAPQTVTVTNRANTTQKIAGIQVGGGNAESFAETNNCGSDLGAGASCTITVTFTPQQKGSLSSALKVDGGGATQEVVLSGTGS